MRQEGESEVENGRPPAVRKAVPPRPPQGARPSRPPPPRPHPASSRPCLSFWSLPESLSSRCGSCPCSILSGQPCPPPPTSTLLRWEDWAFGGEGPCPQTHGQALTELCFRSLSLDCWNVKAAPGQERGQRAADAGPQGRWAGKTRSRRRTHMYTEHAVCASVTARDDTTVSVHCTEAQTNHGGAKAPA